MLLWGWQFIRSEKIFSWKKAHLISKLVLQFLREVIYFYATEKWFVNFPTKSFPDSLRPSLNIYAYTTKYMIQFKWYIHGYKCFRKTYDFFLYNIPVIGINTVKLNSFRHLFLSLIIFVPFKKIRNQYVSDANFRLFCIPNDTKTVKHLLKQKISKAPLKDVIGIANSKVVKTANPIWKSMQLDEQMCRRY